MGRTALVLGGADCLWRDADEAGKLASFGGVIACNDAIAHWPGELDAAVTLHPDKMNLWLMQRAGKGYPDPRRIGYHREGRSGERVPDLITDYAFAGRHPSPSSGIFAAKVAIVDLEYSKAILCGVPLTREAAHFFDAKPWKSARTFIAGFEAALPHLKDKVRSMSGFTAERLGKPDPEWLLG